MVKKIAPKEFNTKGSGIQFCIDGYYVDEVLKQVNGVKIIGCKIRFGMPLKRKKQVIPKKLRQLGCNMMYAIMPCLEAEITLDETTPGAIKKSIKEVANYVGIDKGEAQFSSLTLSNGEGTGRFVKTTKEMAPKNQEDALDLRRKAKMLGLQEATGKIQSLISSIGAGKFQCDFVDVQVKQIALCRRVN